MIRCFLFANALRSLSLSLATLLRDRQFAEHSMNSPDGPAYGMDLSIAVHAFTIFDTDSPFRPWFVGIVQDRTCSVGFPFSPPIWGMPMSVIPIGI